MAAAKPEAAPMPSAQRGTAKLNGIDRLAWLTDVLERIGSGRTKAHEMHTLLPWTWAAANPAAKAEQLAA